MRDIFYNLQLGQVIQLEDKRELMRVPGGWVVTFNKSAFNQVTSVFVPYSDEYEQEQSSDTISGIT